HRIPVAGEADAGRVSRHLQIQRALDPRLVTDPDRRGGEVRGGVGQRDEELAPVHYVAAVDLASRRPEAPAAARQRRIRLPLLDRLAVGLARGETRTAAH